MPNDHDNNDHDDHEDRTRIVTDEADLNERLGKLEPYLIQISGRETGQMYNLVGNSIKIGRDPTCQIALDDPHVSRVHAELVHQPDGPILLRDMGSTNGICINGKPIKEQLLTDGDKILIGTRLYFKFTYQDAIDQNYQQNLFRAANIDSLTQLYNKKYFVDALAKEFSFSKRQNIPLSLLMIDVDFFKKVNDQHGHLAGDYILKSIGEYLLKHLRQENIACRYGGEEFAVILRGVDQALANRIAERLRLSIEQEVFSFRGTAIPITISAGIASITDASFDTIEDFIRRADENLYHAKELGRNRTVTSQAA